jgi:hypothetical protein
MTARIGSGIERKRARKGATLHEEHRGLASHDHQIKAIVAGFENRGLRTIQLTHGWGDAVRRDFTISLSSA